MKNFARLALFFSISFILIFTAAACVRYLQIRIDAVRFLPLRPETPLPDFIAASKWAVPLAVYVSLLLALSFSARNRVSIPASIICLIVLAGAFALGASLGIERTSLFPPARDMGTPLGRPGLILAQQDNVMVLLREPSETRGPRVVSIPGRPLVYQEQPAGPNNTILPLPPIPFRGDVSWSLRSIAIDFSLAGRQFDSRLSRGLVPFLIYALSLIFFLTSLRFILSLSSWPLANLFLGALVFRGILALETFVNSPEILGFFGSFLGNRVPQSLTVPLLFIVFGILINLYTFLVFLAGKRAIDED